MHGKKQNTKETTARVTQRGALQSTVIRHTHQISGVYLRPFTNKPHDSNERIRSHYAVFTQEQHMFSQLQPDNT